MFKNIPILSQYAYAKLVLPWDKPSWLEVLTLSQYRYINTFFKCVFLHQIHINSWFNSLELLQFDLRSLSSMCRIFVLKGVGHLFRECMTFGLKELGYLSLRCKTFCLWVV
jgi:hypothetical protein